MRKMDLRWIAVFCTRCQNLDYFSAFPTKKPRSCKKCGDSNIIIKFDNLAYPEGYKLARKRLTIFGLSLLFTVPIIISFLLFYFFSGIIPPPEILAFEEKIIVLFIVLISIVVPIGIIFTSVWLLGYIYWEKPAQIELCDYIIKKIQEYLPANLTDLPLIDKTKDRAAISWVKDPEGMKILKIKEAKPIVGTCPSCGGTIPFDAKFCTNCGERITK